MIFDMLSCGGCRSCEMACSFHHVGEFRPSVSSIRITDKEDGIGFHVLLVEKADDQHRACDCCQGLEVPLCVQYCKERDVLEGVIKQFGNRTESKRRAGR